MSITYNNPTFKARWHTFTAMVKKELIILTRYPVNFVASFAQVFFIVAIFTLAGLAFSRDGASGSTSSGIVVYGFVLFMFLSDTLWTIGFNIRNEQRQGTLEQLYLSPASKFASLISRVTNLLVWTGLMVSAAVLFMRAMLGGNLPAHNLGLALFILVLSLSGTFGIGFAFAALTLRIREAANTMTTLLQFGFMIFSAMFFPFSALPDWLLVISRLIPVSYSVDAFRSTLLGYPEGFPELAPINTEITIIALFGLLMPIIGFYLYRLAEIRARKTGSLGEY